MVPVSIFIADSVDLPPLTLVWFQGMSSRFSVADAIRLVTTFFKTLDKMYWRDEEVMVPAKRMRTVLI